MLAANRTSRIAEIVTVDIHGEAKQACLEEKRLNGKEILSTIVQRDTNENFLMDIIGEPPAVDAPGNNNSPRIPWIKVTLVLFLLFFCFLLGMTISFLDNYLKHLRRATISMPSSSTNRSKEKQRQTQNPFVQMGRPQQHDEIHRNHDLKIQQYTEKSADHYWNQVLAWGLLGWWQKHNIFPELSSTSINLTERTEYGLGALQLASQQGHPEAQFLVANALAAGFWTSALQQPRPNNNYLHNLTVMDTWLIEESISTNPAVVRQQKSLLRRQQTQSWLLYHTAALTGHVGANLALAYRIGLDTSISTEIKCHRKLPYLAAAAHTLMDELLSDSQSRGSVILNRDKHLLHQIHLHGGGRFLSTENRPDESEETLQFFHVRAMTLHDSFSSSNNGKTKRKSRSSTSDANDDDDDNEALASVAAFTLGRYYHVGARGVAQNTTQAAFYYELAARARHWEAAGQAGTLYLYGIGVPQDAAKARQLFHMGLGGGRNNSNNKSGYDRCKQRFEERLQMQRRGGTEKIFLCDDVSLNGMGVLHLWGIPMVVAVDRELAQQYFELARDQGNPDAAYHLAMMKLGWKTHYTDLDDLDMDGQSSVAEELFSTHQNNGPVGHPTASEYQRILTDLTAAASKHHVLARHRLGLMYEKGVTIPQDSKSRSSKTGLKDGQRQVVVPQDCKKAILQYRYIVEQLAFTRQSRQAYKQYAAGNLADSLRNYLVLAEMGNELGQANAAFLLEQGECLGLNRLDCSRASVRLWKAASHIPEAYLRVGDFYYYGRFRNGTEGAFGPFAFLPYLLYPEKNLLPWLWDIIRPKIIEFAEWEPLSILDIPYNDEKEIIYTTEDKQIEEQCSAEGECLVESTSIGSTKRELQEVVDNLENDLALSVHYYRRAADQSGSPRAHFNLGFMYEWGLGVKQDFPLAKREYDLARANGGSNHAGVADNDLPVTLALWSLSAHEYLVKLWMSWQEYWYKVDDTSPKLEDESSSNPEGMPLRLEGSQVGHPVPNTHHLAGKTRIDVILFHLLAWDSLVILILAVALVALLQLRRTRRSCESHS